MALPPPTTKHKVFAALFLFVLLPAGCVYMIGSAEPDPARENKTTAIVCAKHEVEQKLKAPSTAEFQRSSDMIIETKDNLSYKIGGYVDAQNGFGAMLRTHFICSVTVHPETKGCDTDCSIDQ